MLNFLHTFQPNPIFFNASQIHIYWYGLIVVLGIIAGLITTVIIAKYYNISQDTILDLSFWLIISGIIGARIYDIFLELPYYLSKPLDAFKIWQGGLAIHGAIFAGVVALWFFAKKNKLNLWQLGSIIVPGLALGQAIGRFGNYFNQELFGLPTNLPWGIPIDLVHRPVDYLNYQYFQPTFLYESLGSLIIFFILLGLHYYFNKKSDYSPNSKNYLAFLIVSIYFILYSCLRFSLEFIRIDYAPTFYGLRTPQVVSLSIIIVVLALLFSKNKLTNPSLEK